MQLYRLNREHRETRHTVRWSVHRHRFNPACSAVAAAAAAAALALAAGVGNGHTAVRAAPCVAGCGHCGL